MNFTRQELDAVLTVARKHSERSYWMLLVTFEHGLRVSETLSLTRENFRGQLSIQRLKGSKKTLQPILPAESVETRQAFMKFVAGTDGFLFLPEYTNRTSARVIFWRMMQKFGAEAMLAPDKCHPHILKHTCGRLGYEGGMGIPELKKWLGHVGGQNTLVYMEATEEQAALAFAAAVGR
jgi:type 1 fimbriae regulatory protein FimB